MACTNSLRVYTVRFLPGQDLKVGIEHYVKTNQLKAAFILTCVGSLRRVTLRYATPTGPNGCLPFNEKVFTLCLRAGDDLKDSIETFVSNHNLKAAFILTCVGSLKSVTLSLNATAKLGPSLPAFEKE